jgi:NAD(P)-dependent dehydrogenase (short-subunit alcohol dehydrogenase family)
MLLTIKWQVNNAGVNFNLGSDNSVENAHKVIETNYYGTKNITEALIPLMKPSIVGARIVNVSSRLGRLNGRRNVSKNHLHNLYSIHMMNKQFYKTFDLWLLSTFFHFHAHASTFKVKNASHCLLFGVKLNNFFFTHICSCSEI